MVDMEKVLHGLNSCGFIDGFPNICGVTGCPYQEDAPWCTHSLARDAGMLIHELFEEQKPKYTVCEKCGKPMPLLLIGSFHYDGSDSFDTVNYSWDKERKVAIIETSSSWTGYDLSDTERKETILCPECHKYPFDDDCEIETEEPVVIMAWGSPDDEQEAKQGGEMANA